MSICRGVAGNRGRNPVGIFSTMTLEARTPMQNFIEIGYRHILWKTDLRTIM